MLSGSIYKGLLAISIPIMIMNVVQSLFNIIDMTILKTYDPGNGIAVGAVGVCSSMINLFTVLVIGIATGSNVIIARNIGSNDPQAVTRATGTSVAFSFAAGLALAVIGVLGAETFLQWVNCPELLFDQATLYFRLYFAGIPLLMVYNFCSAILRAAGDTQRPMVFLTLGGIVKVALTFLFIARFRMGVSGVAVATIISWAVTALLGLAALFRSETLVKLRLRDIRFYKRELTQILNIGIPTAIQRVLYSFANVLIAATVNSFGPAATTGISIANNYDGILSQICTATPLAVMPYVSQNIGAHNVKRARDAVWKGVVITVSLGGFFGALSALFSANLASIMSSDPEVIGFAQQKMIIISTTYFIHGINESLGAALRGMGKPVAATFSAFLYMFLFRFVWIYLIFPLNPTLTFLYLVWPVGWTLSIITLMFIYVPTLRDLKKKFANPILEAQH